MMQPRRTLKDPRSVEQIYEHYHIEKDLASRLKKADRDARKTLYASVYNELFERVSHHPQIRGQADPVERALTTASQIRLLRPLLDRSYTFLELGSGDCHLSFEVARYVRKVYAIEVSQEITKNLSCPENCELIISDGCAIRVAAESINLAYSNQVIEHLHPDDARDQVEEVFKALAPGGMYLCITPHRFAGPHDISKYFDRQATGLHLREYTNKELYRLFREVGFSRVLSYRRVGRRYVKLPVILAIGLEILIGALPFTARRKMAMLPPFRNVLDIRLIAIK